MGFCDRGPIVIIRPKGIFYQKVKRDNVARILDETVAQGKVIDELLFVDPVTGKRCPVTDEIPFYNQQKRVVLRGAGRSTPSTFGTTSPTAATARWPGCSWA